MSSESPDPRPLGRTARTVGLIVLVGLLVSFQDTSRVASTSPQSPRLANSIAPFQYVVTILMENNGICDIVPSIISGCGSTAVPAPYLLSLAQTYGIGVHYTGVSHPSEPNYCSLFGGEYLNCATSDGVCCYQDPGPNLVDRLEAAGLTWKAFAEDATNSGTCVFNPPRSSDHFPFLNFKDMNTQARCANFLTTASPGDNELVGMLNSASPANYMWLTPNDQDNMHSSTISFGDNYLQNLVPRILGSVTFSSQRAALFIVFDEGNDFCPSGSTGDCVYALWAGPAAKKAYTSSTSYNHYSYLSTIEANWNLPSLTSNDASAPQMTEFFGPASLVQLSTSFSFTPTNSNPGQVVSFTASVGGGVPPYGLTWNFGDGSTGTGSQQDHVYTNNGTYRVTLTATDSQGATGTATRSVTIGPSPQPCQICYGILNFFTDIWTIVVLTALSLGGAGALVVLRSRALRDEDDEDAPRDTPSRTERRVSEEVDQF